MGPKPDFANCVWVGGGGSGWLLRRGKSEWLFFSGWRVEERWKGRERAPFLLSRDNQSGVIARRECESIPSASGRGDEEQSVGPVACATRDQPSPTQTQLEKRKPYVLTSTYCVFFPTPASMPPSTHFSPHQPQISAQTHMCRATRSAQPLRGNSFHPAYICPVARGEGVSDGGRAGQVMGKYTSK